MSGAPDDGGGGAYLSEFDYSYRRIAVVKCEVEEVVALGIQQIGGGYLRGVPTVVSQKIRILEEAPAPSSSAGTKGSVAC